MSEPMKKRLIKASIGSDTFKIPVSKVDQVKTILSLLEMKEGRKTDSVMIQIIKSLLSSNNLNDEKLTVSTSSFTSKVYGDLPKCAIHLKGARLKEGLTQSDLSKKTGITASNLSKMETGSRPIGDMVASKLAKALNIDIKLLLSN